MDDKGGSEGRILHDPNPSARQAVPAFLHRKPRLPVYMPAIRPVLCSLGLYQDPEAGTNSAQRAGSEASGIHRRHSGLGGDSGEGESSHRSPDLSPGEPGIYSTPRKNRKATISGNRVPGNGGRLKSKGTAPTGSEDKETKTGGSHDDKSPDPAHCSGSVTPTGQVQFGVPSNTSRSAVLQSNSEGPSNGTGRERSVLRHPVSPFLSSHGGTGVVEQSVDSLEREESSAKAAGPSDRVGCLPHRMGSILPGDADGRSMVPAREVTPHKLPGAACGYTGGEDIPEIPGEQEGTITAGQSDSSCLYKQPGWDSFRPRHGAGKKLVDVVPTERDPIDGTTPTREGECQSRHGVESDEGSLRLDAEPVGFPTDYETLPLSGGRFVRDATDPPATSLLQLETRPSSRGDGRVSPGLERGERLRQPPPGTS